MSLEMENATVTVGERRLIDAVSLRVGAGEVVSVVGPNGAGKTTMLSAMAANRSLSTGVTRLNGRPMADWAVAEQAVQRGVLTQAPQLAFPFRVHEVVQFGRMPHRSRCSRGRHADITAAAMQAAEVAGLSERIFTTLSGGEKQRVHLARVLAQVWEPLDDGRSRFLLLDEPTSSLDLKHQHLTLRLARDFADAGGGVLAVLHDLNLAAAYADRIAVMKAGGLAALGTPEDVLTPALIRDVFATDVSVVRHPASGRPCILTGREESPAFSSGRPGCPRHATADRSSGGDKRLEILTETQSTS